ncbi:MAG: CoA transferase [Alphaproteobacteria bacterium]|nr:CoA transferase [Alphaproteobacteria bacterium]MCW5742170.1 CoA transferase [Alphaproteobacteria bacterium]
MAQIGGGLAAAVCGRMLADLGARVSCIGPDGGTMLLAHLNHAKVTPGTAVAEHEALIGAHLIVREGRHDLARLRQFNASAPIVTISPYGETGPQASEPATDLTLFFASGIARLLTGQIDDLSEAPIRPVGEQSAFIAGLAAACAGMHASLGTGPGASIDVSIQEALATLAMTELARVGLGGRSWDRKRTGDGNGATVCILPARDGHVAISPREERQWASWLKAMGSPDWGADPRFATKSDRVKNWDALHALMAQWSRQHDKQWIADIAQSAHVPSLPLRDIDEHLDSPQMRHRGYYQRRELAGRTVQVPGTPFGLSITPSTRRESPPNGPLPLSGVRVLDFSWVIAGPTTTRYLAAMGAEVIKVEAPGSGDPGRASELHTVLGQAKKAIVLDLKKPAAVEIARALAARCDMLIENYATGVMDRLGLGADALKTVNPDLIYISASGMGRSGPQSHAVAYGTLLQSYAGFAGLNRHPDIAPRIGFAWLDPMCGLMLAFAAAAALWHRRHGGGVARIDFSMIEAMLWTLAEPLLATQLGAPPRPVGNASTEHAPHGAWRCAGKDDWVSVAVRTQTEWQALCGLVPGLSGMAGLDPGQRIAAERTIDAALTAWAAGQSAPAAARALLDVGIPAAALARSEDLLKSPHLAARAFWDRHDGGVLPGLPWRASFGRTTGPAPGLGADTDDVLSRVLGLTPGRIAELRANGVLG